MDIKKTLSNPWVLGGGAAIALVLVLTSKGGGGGSSGESYGAVVGAQMAQNAAGLNYAANTATIAATVRMHELDTHAQETIGFLGLMQSMFDTRAVNDTQQRAIAASVTQSQIAAHSSAVQETLQGFFRLQQTWVSADVSKTGIAADADMTKYGIRSAATTALMKDAQETQRQLGSATISAGSNALGQILGFATGFIPKPKAA